MQRERVIHDEEHLEWLLANLALFYSRSRISRRWPRRPRLVDLHQQSHDRWLASYSYGVALEHPWLASLASLGPVLVPFTTWHLWRELTSDASGVIVESSTIALCSDGRWFRIDRTHQGANVPMCLSV